MILYMYIAQGQGQITSDDKISMLIKSLRYFDHFCEQEAKKHFCTLRAGADNSNGVNLEQPGSYYHSEHLLLVSEGLL